MGQPLAVKQELPTSGQSGVFITRLSVRLPQAFYIPRLAIFISSLAIYIPSLGIYLLSRY